MFHGAQLFAVCMIGLVTACGAGLALACARDSWVQRRSERSPGGRP